jgi:hypothetical protein
MRRPPRLPFGSGLWRDIELGIERPSDHRLGRLACTSTTMKWTRPTGRMNLLSYTDNGGRAAGDREASDLTERIIRRAPAARHR